MDINTDKVFVQAVATIKSLTDLSKTTGLPRPTITDRLNLYGLYNQATRGDVSSVGNVYADPNALNNPTELKKHNAWLKFKGLSKSQAREKYIKYLLSILENGYSITTYPEIGILKTNLQDSWNRLENLNLSITLNQNINKEYNPPSIQPPTSSSVPTRLTQAPINTPRSHSPAASLYRMASSGINSNMIRPPSRNQSFSKSRQNSFSGPSNPMTSPPLNVASAFVPGYTVSGPSGNTVANGGNSLSNVNNVNNVNTNVNNSVGKNENNGDHRIGGTINTLDFIRWQGEINNTLLKISTELSNLKHNTTPSIHDAGHRSISGSTTVSVQSELQNYKLRSYDLTNRSTLVDGYTLAELSRTPESRRSGNSKDTDDILRWVYWKMVALVKYLRDKMHMSISIDSLAPKFVVSVIAVLFFSLFKKVVEIYLQRQFGMNLARSSSSGGKTFIQQWKQWLFRMVARRGDSSFLTR